MFDTIRRMNKLLALAVSLTLLQQEPWTPFNDPANKHHPERVATMDVEHYALTLKIDDRKTGEISGEAVITFAPLADVDTVEFDAEDMWITSPGARGAGKRVAIDLGRRVKKGEKTTVKLVYAAKPKHGMFWVTPDKGYPDRHWMVWTQGETEYNHHWFPCYDYPNDRATWEMKVTYPSKYSSVSNGALAASTEADGWKTDHWKQDVPAVTYLASLIVGDFVKVEDTFEWDGRKVPVQYFVPRGLHKEDEIRRTFGRTPEMMKFFSQMTGVPYPYPKYAQTVVHDFIWGGMENISATTLHGFTVVPNRSWMDRDSEGLIAHELAHQWFGDLVTCRDWSHIWLNESFATYFEGLWQEHAGGKDALPADLADGAGWYFGQLEEYNRPIVCDVYTHADDVFDAWAYPKGAWVLHMLRKEIGDAAWWKGINLYLTRHRAQCVGTKDFTAAMEEAHGGRLDWFFDAWLRGLGHPEFEVTTAYDAKTRTLTATVLQKQTPKEMSCGPLKTGTRHFRTRVEIAVQTAKGRRSHTAWVDGAKSEVAIADVDAPLFVEFDPDGNVLKTLVFKRSQAELRRQLAGAPSAASRTWAAGQLAEDAAKAEKESVAALAKALEDPFAGVVRAAADAIARIKSSEGRQALVASNVADARARWAVYQAMGAFLPSDDVEKRLLDAIDRDPSPNCKATAAQALGRGGLDAVGKLEELARRFEKDEGVLPGVLSGLAECGGVRAVDVLVRCTAYGRHAQVRQRAVQALGDVLAKQEAGKRDAKGLDALIALLEDPAFRIRRAAVDKLGAIGEARSVPALEKRIPLEFDMRMVKDIRDAVRRIKNPPPKKP